MQHEEAVQLERRAVPHDLPPAKDDNIVGYQRRCRLLQGRHGRHILDELEVGRRGACNLGVHLVEDGPQFDAKRAIDRGLGDIVEKVERHLERVCGRASEVPR